ncbi:MAG: hypothetical protein HC782_01150 [Gammaproteobacteria bacterium]|nr:hypothetical protein [Gammaproteobacteria bacterium]
MDDMVIYYVSGISLLSITYAMLLQRFPIGQEDHDARLAILAGRTAVRRTRQKNEQTQIRAGIWVVSLQKLTG